MFYDHERKERTEKYSGPRPTFPPVCEKYFKKMQTYLESRRLDYNLARVNGWYPCTWDFGHEIRIVIPCTNSRQLPYWQARAIDNSEPRYRSPAATREDSIVLVWPREYANGSVIVEGPMDALAAAAMGYVGIGLMGNEPSDTVLNFVANTIKVGDFTPVYIVPDLDHLEMGTSLLQRFILNYEIGVSVKLPGQKDLADMNLKEREKLLA